MAGASSEAGTTTSGNGDGRNRLVDALKLFAIALVVLTHVLNLRWEFKHLAPGLVEVMLAFNMPLFAFLSGYVLVGREGTHPVRYLRGKALALLVPYVAWIVVELPLRKVPPSDWLPRVGHALIDPHAGMQMWFLWVLFWVFVVFTVARTINGSPWWMAATGFAFAVGALLSPPSTFGLDKLCWLYPFFVLGYLISLNRDALTRFNPVLGVAGLASFPLLSLLPTHGAVVRFVWALAGIVAAWALFRLLPRPVVAAQASLGSKTLGVYGWQMVVLPFLIVGEGWPGALASWALVMVAAIVLTLVLERTRFTRAVFLGQWPRPGRKQAA